MLRPEERVNFTGSRPGDSSQPETFTRSLLRVNENLGQ